jgi:nicotinate-nucleotide pyrophosphorylase (carboxylating)
MCFVSRDSGVLCGIPVVEIFYRKIDAGLCLRHRSRDGDPLEEGTVFLEVEGPATSILKGERAALNFLQRLSGIATQTARWVEALSGFDTKLLDTRKTTPGWRHLEKYAVRVGGGTNHRQSLSDGILLKDNHAWILRGCGRTDLAEWVAELRRRCPGTFLEIEVDTREEFSAARSAGVDAILLDNFSQADLAWAVEQNKRLGSKPPLLEASGGIRLEVLAEVAATGVDRISAGALTHSVVSLDMSLECGEICPLD